LAGIRPDCRDGFDRWHRRGLIARRGHLVELPRAAGSGCPALTQPRPVAHADFGSRAVGAVGVGRRQPQQFRQSRTAMQFSQSSANTALRRALIFGSAAMISSAAARASSVAEIGRARKHQLSTLPAPPARPVQFTSFPNAKVCLRRCVMMMRRSGRAGPGGSLLLALLGPGLPDRIADL
jgi:hypothetical protein